GRRTRHRATRHQPPRLRAHRVPMARPPRRHRGPRPRPRTGLRAVIATTIVAHHARVDQAHRLSEQLDAALFLDDGRYGERANHHRAITWAAANGTHAVIVQDDAIPIPTFQAAVREAIEHRPHDLISLYVGKV